MKRYIHSSTNTSEYLKTWMPGHHGGQGMTSEELWRKVGSADIYEYATNSSVKMVRIGNFLCSIDENDSRKIKSEDVTELDVNLHTGKNMTNYTSF